MGQISNRNFSTCEINLHSSRYSCRVNTKGIQKRKKKQENKKNPKTDESKRRWQVNNRWSPQKIKSQARIFMITFILFNFMQINRP